MIEETWFETFVEALANHQGAQTVWKGWSLKPWTKVVTKCSVEATKAVLQQANAVKPMVAAIDARDDYKRSEYLTIDCTGYDDAGWGPPIVAVELENRADKLEYSAWKCLCVEADLRVLVCYTAAGGGYPEDVGAAVKRVRKVTRDQRGRHLLLVVGDSSVEFTAGDSAEWRDVFTPVRLP